MKWINIITIVSLLALFSLASCSKLGRIEGNGHVITETRQNVSFNEVINEGIFAVTVIPDTVYEITIEAESNLIPYVRTIVNGNTLVIDSHENLDPMVTIQVTVRMPAVQSVRLSGSGSVTVNDMPESNLTAILSGSGTMNGTCNGGTFKAVLSGSGTIDFYVNTNRVETTLSGSGAIRLGGTTAYANHLISGSGNIDSYSMFTNECDCKISGSGNMYLWVSERLNATISGSGSVYYHGSPVVNTSITGSGTVTGN
ncbi:MAG: DUF2807 domain-containing protein [Bacteroidetes bacterium]|nr:DUF2807 domain-containing protein [Bacteroidota bacterium]